MKFGVGQPVRRKEDDALLRGAGRYVADAVPADALHGFVLRSPHAHARFRINDLAAARGLAGVHLILTADDLADLGPLPCQGRVPGLTAVPDYPILARDVVRHAGDAIAFVVAESLDRARDAAEAIAVDWQPLTPVIEGAAALENGAPRVWPEIAGNLAFTTEIGDREKTDAAFAQAARIVSLRLINQRLVTNYLDTRGVVASCDDDGRLTLTLSSQGSHSVRDVLCNDILKIAPERMRVVTPDVGGGFGTKLFTYREYALAAAAASRLKRTVAWIGDRSEHFLGDSQGRDNVTTAELALDSEHRFLALKVDTIADMGAYLSSYAPFIPFVGAGLLPGVYAIAVCHIRLRGAFTNTVPVDAYRGAGRPEAAYVIERLVDTAAREIGIAPDQLRRKNFIPSDAMPYVTATRKTYDSGDFAGHMLRAQEIADWAGFGARHTAAKRAGRLRGIGLATYIEACGNAGPETAALHLREDGGVDLLIGSQSTGQGHHTAYAQIVADHLDLAPERVRVVQGDTDLIARGAGTGGSSSIPCGGVAVEVAARKLAEAIKEAATDALETGVGDLEITGGAVRVAGTDRSLPFAQIAQSAAAPLSAIDKFAPKAATFPNGTHLAEVEIDPETGAVRILAYVVVDDFGVTLNPLMLAGQVHGGAVQGIGQALMEQTIYDRDSGQLVTASLMDYALPRAEDAPPFVFETRNVRCTTNPLGVKGAGEAGAIGSCPAVMNAIVDALWRAYRIRHVDMPASSERVYRAIAEGRRLHTL